MTLGRPSFIQGILVPFARTRVRKLKKENPAKQQRSDGVFSIWSFRGEITKKGGYFLTFFKWARNLSIEGCSEA